MQSTMPVLPHLPSGPEQQHFARLETGASAFEVYASHTLAPQWHTTDLQQDSKVFPCANEDTGQSDRSRKRIRLSVSSRPASQTSVVATSSLPAIDIFTPHSKAQDDSQRRGVDDIEHDEDQAATQSTSDAVGRPPYRSTFDSDATITLSMFDKADNAFADDVSLSSTSSSLNDLHAAIPYLQIEMEHSTVASPLNTSQLPDNLWFDLSLSGSLHDQDSQDHFQITLDAIQRELATSKQTIEEFAGADADIGALIHRKLYKRAPRLSQIVADLLKKLLPFESLPSVTTIAIMWLHWHMWRWVLAPTSENYAALPKVMRPTAAQCAVPHALAIDFLILPTTRTAVCHGAFDLWNAQGYYYACLTLHGPRTTLHALCKDLKTQRVGITQSTKSQAAESANWSQA